MIDKRVKNAAPSRDRQFARKGEAAHKSEGPRQGTGPRKPRPDRGATQEGREKPRRFAGTDANPKAAKPALYRKAKPRKQNARPPRDDADGMRIAKVMARAGLCSRRDAESWIAEGRVFLNGKVLTSPAINIGPQDQVSVDGVALAERERTRLFLFHKPRGLVTTDKDPEGRNTIFDHLHQTWPDGPRVISIGRLDINTEGLLLLTNDGGLARVLELPTTGWMRRYRVRANGKTDQAVLDRLRDGLTIDGIDYAGIDATLDRVQGDNVWLSLGLREGKNREIKRVLEHIGLFVNRLIRISFGPFQLGELAEGKVEEVRTRVLRDQLGPALANEAGADFESPLTEPQREPAAPAPRARKPRENNPRDEQRGGRPAVRDRKPATRNPRDKDARPSPPSGRQRSARQETREAPAPIEPSFKPRGPRKHISAMRATGVKPEQGERKKSILSETADRKGRAVVVERKAKAAPRRLREEPVIEQREKPEARAPRSTGRTDRPAGRTERPSGRFKPEAAAASPSGKGRNTRNTSTSRDSPRPARDAKAALRKPSADGKKNADAHSRAATPAKGFPSKGAPPKGGRPVKPGRPRRPR